MESHELGQPSLQKDDFSEEVISQILEKGVNHTKNKARQELNTITHIVHVVFESQADPTLQRKLGPVVKPCKICKDVVGDHHIVRRHSYVDPSANPYMCGICREAFNQGYLLKIHLELEHGFIEEDSNRRSLRIRNKGNREKESGVLGSSTHDGNVTGRPQRQSESEKSHQVVESGKDSSQDGPNKKKTSRPERVEFIDDEVVQDKENQSRPSPDETILLSSNRGRSCAENDDAAASVGGSDCEDGGEDARKKEQYKNGDLIVINLFTEGGTGDSPRKKPNRKQLQKVNEGDASRYKCDFCNLSFPSQQKRGVHIKQDHPGAKLKCQLCGDEFSERRLLTLHLKTHKKERPPPKPKKPKRIGPPLCMVCNKTFQHESGLQIHTQSFHPELVKGERKFCCEKCGSMFWTKTAMFEHQRIHSDERPFVCSYCKKGFCRKSDLKSHTKIHTGEKPYACTQCDKTFRQRLQLVNHLRVHSGERPYKCDTCGKTCAKRDHLTRHMRIHTKERPYKCSHCDKSFKTNGNLRDHVRLHTGDKPFKCKHCGKAFAQSTNLVHHERTHSGLKPYVCSVCQKRFPRSNSLKVHMKTHNDKRVKVRQPPTSVTLPMNDQQHQVPLIQETILPPPNYMPEQPRPQQLPTVQPMQQMNGPVILKASDLIATLQSVLQFDDVTSQHVDIPVVSQQGLGQGNLCGPPVENFVPSAGSIVGGHLGTTVGSFQVQPNTPIPGYGPMDSQGVAPCESIAVVLSNMSDFQSIQNTGLGGFQ